MGGVKGCMGVCVVCVWCVWVWCGGEGGWGVGVEWGVRGCRDGFGLIEREKERERENERERERDEKASYVMAWLCFRRVCVCVGG
jgi:hypothetical protein